MRHLIYRRRDFVLRGANVNRLTLIYFRDCPNANRARQMLKELGFEFHEVVQDELSPDSRLRRYTSPTLLAEDRLVFGGELGQGGTGCTMTIPSEQQLKQLIAELAGV